MLRRLLACAFLLTVTTAALALVSVTPDQAAPLPFADGCRQTADGRSTDSECCWNVQQPSSALIAASGWECFDVHARIASLSDRNVDSTVYTLHSLSKNSPPHSHTHRRTVPLLI